MRNILEPERDLEISQLTKQALRWRGEIRVLFRIVGRFQSPQKLKYAELTRV